ncbi:hypothetical protein BSKO_10690 [Bryopsis sp. KO-2023]|nr:hypothetical protein BSKO_10690 [Bryopsis sp. KO-2023]
MQSQRPFGGSGEIEEVVTTEDVAEDSAGTREEKEQEYHRPSAKGRLSKRLSVWFNDPALSDVTLEMGDGTKFKCHKVILAANSVVFKWRFCVDKGKKKRKIVETGVSSVFEGMLKCMYSGEVEVFGRDLLEVMILAEKYEAAWLANACKKVMVDRRDPGNCCKVFERLIEVDEQRMARSWGAFMHNCLGVLKTCESFLSLRFESVKAFLGGGTTDDSCEGLVCWLRHDWSVRKVHVGELFSQLFLFDLSESTLERLSRSDILVSDSKVKDLVDSALACRGEHFGSG